LPQKILIEYFSGPIECQNCEVSQLGNFPSRGCLHGIIFILFWNLSTLDRFVLFLHLFYFHIFIMILLSHLAHRLLCIHVYMPKVNTIYYSIIDGGLSSTQTFGNNTLCKFCISPKYRFIHLLFSLFFFLIMWSMEARYRIY
jgi:hypothetical protein